MIGEPVGGEERGWVRRLREELVAAARRELAREDPRRDAAGDRSCRGDAGEVPRALGTRCRQER